MQAKMYKIRRELLRTVLNITIALDNMNDECPLLNNATVELQQAQQRVFDAIKLIKTYKREQNS